MPGQVDAYELTVESPTPLKNYCLPDQTDEMLEAMERQRQEWQPLPEHLSLAAALNGIFKPRSPPHEDREGATEHNEMHLIEEEEERRSVFELGEIREEIEATPQKSAHLLEFDHPLSLRRPTKRRESELLEPSSRHTTAEKEKENSPVQQDPFQALLDACHQSHLSKESLPSMDVLLSERLKLEKVRLFAISTSW